MEFLGSYLLFLVVGCTLITGFCAFLFALNYTLFPGPTWWASLIMAAFLIGMFAAILAWCIRNHKQEKKFAQAKQIK